MQVIRCQAIKSQDISGVLRLKTFLHCSRDDGVIFALDDEKGSFYNPFEGQPDMLKEIYHAIGLYDRPYRSKHRCWAAVLNL